MKGLSETLKESLDEARNALAAEIQGDDTRNAAYSTLDVSHVQKFKHAFLSYSQHEDAVFIVAFNSIEDYQELLDTDDDEYSALLSMKPQDTKVVNGISYICLK